VYRVRSRVAHSTAHFDVGGRPSPPRRRGKPAAAAPVWRRRDGHEPWRTQPWQAARPRWACKWGSLRAQEVSVWPATIAVPLGRGSPWMHAGRTTAPAPCRCTPLPPQPGPGTGRRVRGACSAFARQVRRTAAPALGRAHVNPSMHIAMPIDFLHDTAPRRPAAAEASCAKPLSTASQASRATLHSGSRP